MREGYLFQDSWTGWRYLTQFLAEPSLDAHLLLPSREAERVFHRRWEEKSDRGPVHTYTPSSFLNLYLEKWGHPKRVLAGWPAEVLFRETGQTGNRFLSHEDVLEPGSTGLLDPPVFDRCPYGWPHELVAEIEGSKVLPLFPYGVAYGFGFSTHDTRCLDLFLRASRRKRLLAFSPTTPQWFRAFSLPVRSIPSKGEWPHRWTLWTAPNSAQECRWGANRQRSSASACVVFSSAVEPALCLDQMWSNGNEDNDAAEGHALAAWVTWQEEDSLEAFWGWVAARIDLSSEEREELRKAALKAYHLGLTDHFSTLRELAESGSPLPRIPKWPIRGEWATFVRQMQAHLPPFLQKLSREILKEGEPFDGMVLGRQVFFEALKQRLRERLFPPREVISFREACLFGWDSLWIPFLNAKFCSPNEGRSFLSFLRLLVPHCSSLYLSMSLADLEGHPLLPFWGVRELPGTVCLEPIDPPPKIFAAPISSGTNIPSWAVRSTESHDLPKKAIFSCKTWERLLTYPGQAWFENVLKIPSVSIPSPPFSVARRIHGEWVHEGLSFEGPPPPPEEWIVSIRAKMRAIKQRVAVSQVRLSPLWLQTWEQARLTAETLACRCVPMGEGFFRFSERDLPPTVLVIPGTDQSLVTYGRVDYLIGTVDFSSSSPSVGPQDWVEIVDFKTRLGSPVPSKSVAEEGELQTALYGLIMQKLWGLVDIRLTLLRSGGEKLQRSLSSAKEALAKFWGKLAHIQRTRVVGEDLGICHRRPTATRKRI